MSLDVLSSTAQTASRVFDTLLTSLRPYQWYAFDAGVVCAATWLLLRRYRAYRRRLRTTQLPGPPSESFLYGVGKRTLDVYDNGASYEGWAQEYGPVYSVPSTLGTNRVVLCDPKAIAHFYSKETWTYILIPFQKRLFATTFGRGLLWAHGEDHRRQRKSLTPAFSVAAIRQLTSIFYDSAYKAKGAWDALIESSGEDSTVIEVQNWMNHISLDTIGLAGFSHNFGALEGKHASVSEIFDTFGASPRASALNEGLFLLGQAFPFLTSVPTRRTRLIQKLHFAMEEISTALLAKTQEEREIDVSAEKGERSVIGLLIKGANENSEFHLTKEEVIAQASHESSYVSAGLHVDVYFQMKVLLVAGYETTSVSMTWALLELSRNPDAQTKLRNELLEHGADPTYDKLTHGLPYLDAVVHEILRIHPAVKELTRVAIEDDVIPLSQPVRTKSGELVDSLTIAKGTLVAIPMESVNRSAAVWGEDAKMFRPSRWIEDRGDGIPAKAKEIQGHKHLLTFSDGPRTCLGKNFAVTEFKAVLAVLIKHFVFELQDGVDAKIEIGRGLLPRPKLAGEVGCRLPLRVRPYVA